MYRSMESDSNDEDGEESNSSSRCQWTDWRFYSRNHNGATAACGIKWASKDLVRTYLLVGYVVVGVDL